MGRGNKRLYATSGLHDQDGRHAHIVKTAFKIFSGTKEPMTLVYSIGDMSPIEFEQNS